MPPPLNPIHTMASTTPRKVHGSRKGDIPHSFVQKWRSSGPKQLVRRPLTACQACRTARVKCDNQPQCDRCATRDLICRYTNSDVRGVSAPNDFSSATTAVDDASPREAPQTTLEEIFIGSETTTAASHPFMGTGSHYEDFEVMTDWHPNAIHQDLVDFTWPSTATVINVRYPLNLPKQHSDC